MKQNEKTFVAKIQLRAYSLKELSGLYELSGKSMKTWLAPFKQEIGQRVGRFYTPKQMKIIFKKLGAPCTYYWD
jgi:hypothetical protein